MTINSDSLKDTSLRILLKIYSTFKTCNSRDYIIKSQPQAEDLLQRSLAHLGYSSAWLCLLFISVSVCLRSKQTFYLFSILHLICLHVAFLNPYLLPSLPGRIMLKGDNITLLQSVSNQKRRCLQFQTFLELCFPFFMVCVLFVWHEYCNCFS